MYQLIVLNGFVPPVSLAFPGVSITVLNQDSATGGMTVLTSMEAGATIPEHSHSKADETVFVIEGDFVEAAVSYGPGTFFSGKAATNHGPHHSVTGCTVLTQFSAELDFNLAESRPVV